jgi:hypothetical protein
MQHILEVYILRTCHETTQVDPCNLLSPLYYIILFKFSHSNLFHVNVICNTWPWKNLYSFFETPTMNEPNT